MTNFDYHDYPFDYASTGEADGIMAMFLIFYLIYFLVVIGISVVQYVLYSLGTYTIAKRRGIKHPWLSWVPVGSTWILGCISDQYQYVVKGKVKNKRKALLVLSLLTYVLTVVACVVYIVALVGSMMEYPGMTEPVMTDILPAMLGVMGMMLVVIGISVAASVLTYMALYDLYSSCEPRNNVLYLVLSIFISISMPILVFICRKKDLGMPPRKPQPVQEAWKPVEPPKEPWENNPEV